MLFPRRCPVCDRPVKLPGKLICGECREKIKYVGEAHCLKCGKPTEQKEREYCFDCEKRKHGFVQGKSLFEYKSAADSIYRFKYAKRREYAEFYGEEMERQWRELMREWEPQAIVPVPIHKSRRRARGYNQAELLAEELGRRFGIPVEKELIVRCKKTVPQKELSGEQRQNNLKRAFKISKNDVKLSTIIIMDDIYTTGSTVDAMSEVLKKSGVDKIYVLSLAIGSGL